MLVPSPMLRTLSAAARWALWLLLAAWLLFALSWGALHLLIVPRIGELRAQLETEATQILGVTVRIGSITAQSSGMVPSFELADVRLLDAQGRVALTLPRVLAALSPRSLLGFGFEQLYIDQPALNVRRGPDGKIFVAGLDFSTGPSGSHSAADWFFSQTEFVIRNGTIEWVDEMRNVPALALRQVDFVMRNKARNHDLRFDATPPPQWGERFALLGVLRQPLLSVANGRWREWQGQFHAAFSRVDVSQLRPYAELGVDVAQGNGAMRVWVDVDHAAVRSAVADVALAEVSVTLGPQLKPLQLQSVTGRLGGRSLLGGYEVFTQGLQFATSDGRNWPGGNVRISHVAAGPADAAHGEIEADRMDLAALSQIASHLPLGTPTHAILRTYAPKGLVERLQANWSDAPAGLARYAAKGKVVQLELGVQREAGIRDAPDAMGVRGANLEFDVTQSGGRAKLSLVNGELQLPGVFETSAIPVAQLNSDVIWQIQGEHLALQLPNLSFANVDAQGELQFKWQTSDPARSRAGSRYPGILDLQGSLARFDASRVHRYLPLALGRQAREYVRDAVLSGAGSAARFKVKGDLHDLPFIDPRQGEFRISANVQDAVFAYVPRSLQSADSPAWPVLSQLSAEVMIDRATLQIKGARGSLLGAAGAAGLQLSKGEGLIADLTHNATVAVSAEARGALAEMLGVVNGSPVGPWTGQALAHASATGNAELRLKLNVPLLALDKTSVQGSVTLAGNDIQISPDTPKLGAARGVIGFSENGFAISGGQARMLGGELRLAGGAVPATAAGPAGIVLRGQGTFTAEGLRQARELGFVSRLALQASGAAAYTAVLGFRRGHSHMDLAVNSTLVGLALNLPAPLVKAAESALPLRLETALLRDATPAATATRLQDQLSLDLGRLISIGYVRDVSGAQARVLRGTIAVGLAPDESAPMPEEGVVANISLAQFDLDAWGAVLSQVAQSSFSVSDLVAPPAGPGVPGRPASGNAALAYLPTTLAVRAAELTVGGRKLNHVVVGGSREGLLWRANLDARELNGYMEYRQPSGSSAGRLYSRLARLTLAQSSATEVEALLDEQPSSIPALDIVVEDLELRGKRLGRVEIEAVNRGAGSVRDGSVREWRLNKFNVVTSEAAFTATGNWATINSQNGQLSQLPRALGERRRTVMNFRLDITDAGELLNRFGMKEVIRRGRGKMEGQVAWIGSPLTPDYPSMAGSFSTNVEGGQFLKADPGIAKLLGVLSLQALPRRLTLDFRDVFSEGFAFDFIRGDVNIAQGVATTNNLQMKGVNAAVLMDGRADIAKETQDIRVVVVPEINAGTASLIATAINPAIGLGSFLAQLFLRRPLIEAGTQEFHVDGTWTDPKIAKVERRAGAPAKPADPGNGDGTGAGS